MEPSSQISEIAVKANSFFDAGVSYSLNLLTAVLLLVAGYMIAAWVKRALIARLGKIKGIDRTLVPVVAQIGRYGVLCLTVILVLSEFGVQTASIITVLGAAGLAIGLALQGTLQNVAAGLMLLVIRPFQIGHYVDAGGVSGTVDEIGLFVTRMHTPQNIDIVVPNASIFSGVITNYSTCTRRRLDLGVGISYDDDIDAARDVLDRLVKADDRFMTDPAPRIVVKSLGESSVDLQIRAWVDNNVYWDVYFDMMREIKLALDKANISIPYPHRQIIMTGNTAPVPAKPAGRAPRKKKAA